MMRWKLFLIIGIVLLILTIAVGRRLTSPVMINGLASLTISSTHPPEIYLSGPLKLFPSALPVLGWDTEEIIPSEIIKLVNEERRKAGSPVLKENSKLAQAANMRVMTILKNQNFSHEDPIDHIQLSTVLPRVDYLFSYASENMGLAQDKASGIVHGFMSSPSHKQNLLDSKLVETGVAVRKGQFKGNYVVIVVQVFAIPASKEAYLGYSQDDKVQVQNLLDGVDNQLVRTRGFLVASPDSQYYKDWEKVLLNQKQRLSEIYQQMLSDSSF